MYHIIARHLITGEELSRIEEEDAGRAYELAHQIDAEIQFGDEDDVGKWLCPTTVRIEDEHGYDRWHHCCMVRCPTIGL